LFFSVGFQSIRADRISKGRSALRGFIKRVLKVKIAIGGKGGVGKTTVCAIWAQLFAEEGSDVLAIDADPNANLALAFGIPSEKNPVPLISMKELIAERTGTGKDAVGSYFRLNPRVSDLPEKYWVEIGLSGHKNSAGSNRGSKLRLLVLGAITQAGAGCACPEGAFLKALLTHTILQRREVVLVDMAAGVEFMGRASIRGIDALVLVVEPGGRSIETTNNLAKMARELGIKNVAAITNKITEPSQKDLIRSELKDVALLGILPYSPSVQQADLQRASVIKVDVQFVEQLRKAKDVLTDLIGSNVGSEANV
jgi:CO dehydrogenase maturation factor